MTAKNEDKKPAMTFDIGTALVIGAAAFQSYQFGRALYVYDPAGWNIKEVSIGGLFLGAIVNVIVVLAATRLPMLTAAAIKTQGKADKKKMAANARKEQKAGVQARFAQAAFVGLLMLSPALVAPAMYISWQGLPLPPKLIMALAIGWASVADISIALGGFVAGKSLVHLGSDAPKKSSVAQANANDAGSDAERPATSLKSRSAKKSTTLNVAPAKIYQCECGEKFVDRFKYSGHTRTCATRKEIVASKDLTPVDIQAKMVVKQ